MPNRTIIRNIIIFQTFNQFKKNNQNIDLVIYTKPSQKYSEKTKVILSFELLDCEENEKYTLNKVKYNLFHITNDNKNKSLIHSNSEATLISKNIETDNKTINDIIFDYYHLNECDKLSIEILTPNVSVRIKTTIIEDN